MFCVKKRCRKVRLAASQALLAKKKTVVGTDNEVRAEGEITAFYSSDARLKENVVTIDGALDKVMAMRGVSFDDIMTRNESPRLRQWTLKANGHSQGLITILNSTSIPLRLIGYT